MPAPLGAERLKDASDGQSYSQVTPHLKLRPPVHKKRFGSLTQLKVWHSSLTQAMRLIIVY